jgi:hypothetical protein
MILFVPLTWTSILAYWIWIQWEKRIQNQKEKKMIHFMINRLQNLNYS